MTTSLGKLARVGCVWGGGIARTVRSLTMQAVRLGATTPPTHFCRSKQACPCSAQIRRHQGGAPAVVKGAGPMPDNRQIGHAKLQEKAEAEREEMTKAVVHVQRCTQFL